MKEMEEIELEKRERLEKQRMKKEKFQANMKKISKEEIFLKRIEMKEIKENAWKWRGGTSSHEEQAKRMEKGKKVEEKEKVINKIRKSEAMKKEEENAKRKDFLAAWKEKEERKNRQKLAQESWITLMKNVEEWEELIMEEEEIKVEGKNDTELTQEGFKEAGNFMEIVIEEAIAFSELIGTVVANNDDHQSFPKVSLGGAIPPSPPP